jgi:DNA-binding CsgD family transcriptional regulator
MMKREASSEENNRQWLREKAMPATLLRKKNIERLENNHTIEPEISCLLEQLIYQTKQNLQSSDLAKSQINGQEIILDIEVDGVRCVLIRTHPQPVRSHAGLSPREVEIARMVAEGYPNKIIADVLDISLWTVGTHLRRIFAKLGVGSRAAMVTRLIEEGVICKYPSHVGLLPLKIKH